MVYNPENTNNFSTNDVESFEDNKRKKTKKYINKALAIGLAVPITISSMFMTGCSASNTETPPVEKPPVEEPQEIEKMPTVESLQISAELIDKPEELVQELLNKAMTNWENAGANKSNYELAVDALINEEIQFEDFSKELAPKYDDLYIKALFPADWESTQSLVDVVDVMSKIHGATLTAYLGTSTPAAYSEDKEPYSRNVIGELLEVVSKSDDTIVLKVKAYDTDNADMNRVGEEYSGGKKADPNHIAIHEFTLAVEGNSIKIINDKIIDRP
jgi:hypothetical protein